MFSFSVVGGVVAREIIQSSRPEIVGVVREAYLTHHAGRSVNPNSYFLRFPDKPEARLIALPAYLGGEREAVGIKWIGSFPKNIERNIPRASAVLLLNDYATGYPFACLEASQISAARTAASAVLGAEQLSGGKTAAKVAVIGSGIIARNIVEFFHAQSWNVEQFAIFDRAPQYAQALADYARTGLGYAAAAAPGLDEALAGADVVVLATTAAAPYIAGRERFGPGQIVLNISLRDIDPDIIAHAHNVLDDIDHCMTANTSPHLTEQKLGHRDFIDGTLAGLMRGEFALGADKPKIFSPFGLGVLDLAVGLHVYERATAAGRAVPIDDFFGETERWSG